MSDSTRTSAEAFEDYVPGILLKERKGQSSEDLLVQIFARNRHQDSIIIPAVPEPLIVWILSGQAVVEERELGGAWQANSVAAGDFFLTTAPAPTELRWQASGPDPFEVMHVYVGLPLLKKAVADVRGKDLPNFTLREVSGEQDAILSALLAQLHRELNFEHKPSAAFMQGIGQSLTVHLVRHYAGPLSAQRGPRGGLPAHKLRRVTALLERQLAEPFDLAALAQAAGLSEFHFSRAFKASTGLAPSRYFIRMRMEQARRLLCETAASVVEVGLAVGYSSPSHFAQVFRRETGVAPSEYRLPE